MACERLEPLRRGQSRTAFERLFREWPGEWVFRPRFYGSGRRE